MPSQQQLLDVIALQTEIAKLGLDLSEVMDLVVERTPELINADGAAIEIAEGDDMVYRATSGLTKAHLGMRLKRDDSLSGWCVETGATQYCDDSELDPRVDRDACRRIGLRSMIVMPLLHRGQAIGVLKAVAKQPKHFAKGDIVVLSLLSEVIAAAMHFATALDSDVLFHRATHDGLTDLANRSLFLDRLQHTIGRSHRKRSSAGILMIDLDGLKQVNDSFGHRAGDAMLKEVAMRIRTAARSSDTVARIGGDEFAVILNPVDGPDDIEAAVQRMDSQIQAPFLFERRTFPMRASIGSACCPHDGSDLDQLLDVADQRMYAAKREHHGGQIDLLE
jgi:diguanylate cyclase (GGDEF)-like protein